MNVIDKAAITSCAAPKLYALLDSPVAKFANHPSDEVVGSVPDPELDSDPSLVFGESLVAFELCSNKKVEMSHDSHADKYVKMTMIS